MGIELRKLVDINEFHRDIQEHLDALEQGIVETLKLAGIGTKVVAKVFLTGGSSQVRPVKRLFQHCFGREKMNQDNRLFSSVAQGLALAQGLG